MSHHFEIIGSVFIHASNRSVHVLLNSGSPCKIEVQWLAVARSLRCPGEHIGAEIQADGLDGLVLQTNEGSSMRQE